MGFESHNGHRAEHSLIGRTHPFKTLEVLRRRYTYDKWTLEGTLGTFERVKGPHTEQMDTQIKRYVVVAWDFYYPSGGLGNIKGLYSTKEEAQEAAKNPKLIQTYDNVDVEDLLDYQ